MKLKEVCEIKNGYAFKSEEYVNSGIRVIRITNVQKGYIEDENPQFYPIEMEKDLKDYMLKKDDLLISLTGNVGRVALLGEEFLPAALNQRVGCIRVNKQDIDIKYIFYNLLSKRFEDDCIKYSKGIAQKNMSTEWLKEYEIVIKSVEDQNKVVRILDILQSSIKKYKMLLSYFDTLIKARFVEMFGDPIANNMNWKKFTLKELTDVRDGTHESPEYVMEGYPFITSKNISNGRIDFNGAQYISNEDYRKFDERSHVDDGDILMPMIGTIGGAVIVKKDRDFSIKNVALIKFHNKSVVNNIFIQSLLNSNEMKDFFITLKTGGTQKFISLGVIRDLPIINPPLHLQNEYCAFVQHIDKLKFE